MKSTLDTTFQQVLHARRDELTFQLQRLAAEREHLDRQEARIIQQIRSIDTLLAAEVDVEQDTSPAENHLDVSESTTQIQALTPGISKNGQTATTASLTPVLKDTSERICSAVDRVLRQTGVPLHYRQIAEAVEQEIPLRGKDSGATLLAHLSRATDRFVRVGRGIYWFANEPLPNGVVAAQPSASHSRRVKRKKRSR